MLVEVFPPSRNSPAFNSLFALQQDNWNDYSFQTLYHLYRRASAGDKEPTLIGSVKILRKGQTKADTLQVRVSFDQLSSQFCSVGNSLDYYQRLNEIPSDERNRILDALCDVVRNPSYQQEFKSEEGWEVSLFRDNPDPESFLQDAEAILTGNFAAIPGLEIDLSFQPLGWEPVKLNFAAPEPFLQTSSRRLRSGKSVGFLPRRVIVVIGRNGSGKSTLLARLARVGFAAPSDRLHEDITQIGIFNPLYIGFPKIIAISYSAFDNFIVPGRSESELEQIAKDIEMGKGRYIYAGLRDIVREVRDDLDASRLREAPDEKVIVKMSDRKSSTHLKSLTQLAEEFGRLVERIHGNGDNALFIEALEPLLNDPSFPDESVEDTFLSFQANPVAAFLDWSTGHKIALHVVASIVANATRKSLILFDEPESHLHPPFVAALMHSLRIVLEERDSYAVIATHSPVILQETLARHVRIVRRTGDRFDVYQPGLETFGENVGALTYDVFGLVTAASDYHLSLDELIEIFSTIEEIDELFTPGLSGQARAYVMAGLARKDRLK